MEMECDRMITLLLAYISAKYNIEFDYLYLGTVIIDLGLIDILSILCKNKL